MTTLELTGSTMHESKRSNMKQFVDAAKEYLKTKTEKHSTQINRHLQVSNSCFWLLLKASLNRVFSGFKC